MCSSSTIITLGFWCLELQVVAASLSLQRPRIIHSSLYSNVLCAAALYMFSLAHRQGLYLQSYSSSLYLACCSSRIVYTLSRLLMLLALQRSTFCRLLIVKGCVCKATLVSANLLQQHEWANFLQSHVFAFSRRISYSADVSQTVAFISP